MKERMQRIFNKNTKELSINILVKDARKSPKLKLINLNLKIKKAKEIQKVFQTARDGHIAILEKCKIKKKVMKEMISKTLNC